MKTILLKLYALKLRVFALYSRLRFRFYVRFNPGFAARNAAANRQAQREALERFDKGDYTGWKFYGGYGKKP